MLTKETDYALRLVMHLEELADEGKEGFISVMQLSEELDIPYRFLRRISGKLTACGIFESARGKLGGIRLNDSRETLSLLDVIRAVDNDSLKLNFCLKGKNACTWSGKCRLHPVFSDLQHCLETELGGLTFREIIEKSESGAGGE
jgi:Rrf2 family protein